MMTLKDFLKKLRKVEFLTHQKTTGTLVGAYHSAFKGRGMTFAECKPYEDGDDIRYIDWHASARQQGIFVKQCIEERELNICIIVDLSNSMQFGSLERTKAEAAIEAMSVLSFSALKNHDKVSIALFNNQGMKYLPPQRGSSNVIVQIIEALNLNPNNDSNSLNTVLKKVASLQKRRSVLFIISDFIHPKNLTELHRLAFRHEVIPIIISDPMEAKIPDLGLIRLKDGLSGSEKWIDTENPDFKHLYAENFQQRLSAQKETFNQIGLHSIRISTVGDIVRPMIRALKI